MTNTLNIIDAKGASASSVELTWLEREAGEQAIHDAVIAFLASLRAGTACTKTRSDVSGGGKKPFKQKGTGRARAGSTRSPIWRGGGTTFGPTPRSFAKGINKKVKKLALRRAFTDRVDAGDVIVVEDIQFDAPKTKLAVDFLNSVNAGDRAIVIVNDTVIDQNLENLDLAFGNLDKVFLLGVSSLNTYEMLSGKKVVITTSALEALGKRLAKEA